MMRGPKDFAVAVRRADGEIVTTSEDVDSIIGRFKWLDRPFLRGTLALIDAMALGIKALKYSPTSRWPMQSRPRMPAPRRRKAMRREEQGERHHRRRDDGGWACIRPGALLLRADLIIKPLRHAVPIGLGADGARGRGQDSAVRGLRARDLDAEGHPTSLPVPRRGAQDDQCLRGRRGADARERDALYQGPRSLRDQLHTGRAGDRALWCSRWWRIIFRTAAWRRARRSAI